MDADAEEEEEADKENAAPGEGIQQTMFACSTKGHQAQYDVHYPPLPLNTKGNIVMKHPCSNASTHNEPVQKSNTCRKRHNVEILTETPPRSSRSSQISQIFPRAATPKRSVASAPILQFPTSIPDEAMRVYEHFIQAMRNTPPKRQQQKPETPKSKGKGRCKASGKKTTPRSLRKPDSKRSVPPPSPATSPADSDHADGLNRVDSGCDLRSLTATELAGHWPEITSAPRSESPPPVIPKPIPDPIPHPMKPQSESASPSNQPVYPDLSGILGGSSSSGHSRSNALTDHKGSPPRRLLPSVSTIYHDPPRSAPDLSNQYGNNITEPHNLDRLTLINHKLAQPTISPPPHHSIPPISFLADPDTQTPSLEHAIAQSFSSTFPTAFDRRRTLNIKLPPPPPPSRTTSIPLPSPALAPAPVQHPESPAHSGNDGNDDDDDDSSDSWTGDELFFPHPHPRPAVPESLLRNQRIPPPARSQLEGEGGSTSWRNRREVMPTSLSIPIRGDYQDQASTTITIRVVRESRVQDPQQGVEVRGRGKVGFEGVWGTFRDGRDGDGGGSSGVPLSMEEHPSSDGSDADGEEEEDEVEVEVE
ncbi:hypothetical protein DOTSEDRAFT_39220 [Dothistroma septosporum NZE10]|uniref:Uncharacterized protein n=1 Tax=Dothistroma septosporum (strain NZE10 / CBS 128990) TaxID=675120 RepID=M2XHV8_DOTSN|nr:hypothetical protein DOTSEDRAFT_39220 [Dothistroma septosporum NZE10]